MSRFPCTCFNAASVRAASLVSAMVPAEIEFRTVAVKVFLAHLVVNPVMATFDQSEKRLSGVDVHREAGRGAASVLVVAVTDGVVPASVVLPEKPVVPRFVGQDSRTLIDNATNFFGQGGRFNSFNRAAPARPSRSTSSTTGVFLVPFRATTGNVAQVVDLARPAADVGFVHFDGTRERHGQRTGFHRVPNAMEHEPSGP